MSRFKFKKNEVVYNTIEANPSKRIHISGSVFYDNDNDSGFKPNRFVEGTTLNILRADSDYRPNFVSSDVFADTNVTGTLTRDYNTTSNVGVICRCAIERTQMHPLRDGPIRKINRVRAVPAVDDQWISPNAFQRLAPNRRQIGRAHV